MTPCLSLRPRQLWSESFPRTCPWILCSGVRQGTYLSPSLIQGSAEIWDLIISLNSFCRCSSTYVLNGIKVPPDHLVLVIFKTQLRSNKVWVVHRGHNCGFPVCENGQNRGPLKQKSAFFPVQRRGLLLTVLHWQLFGSTVLKCDSIRIEKSFSSAARLIFRCSLDLFSIHTSTSHPMTLSMLVHRGVTSF